MQVPHPVSEGVLLAKAFSEFIAASASLESSYRDLQGEVAALTQALSERNEALQRSRSENRAMGDRLKHILESIPCGVLVLAEDGSVWLANPEATRLLHLPPNETEATKFPIPGLHLELSLPAMEEEEDEQELSFESPEGTVWLAIRRVPLPLTTSVSFGKGQVVLTLRDITARKQMEKEREAARDNLALAQVSAILAHEIRNPLASMELFAGLLTEDRDRADEWLSHLRAGIRSLSGTVNNVLTLHGDTPLTLEPVNIAEEAALAVEFLQPIAWQAEVQLSVRTAGSSHSLKARGNRGAIHQILLNLCANAMRHTARNGVVEVTCGASAGDVRTPYRMEVRDTGCGIPTEHLPRLFEVGFSGSGATSGLGLAVCDRLARQMSGTLQVTSLLGHGSTFTLELPQA